MWKIGSIYILTESEMDEIQYKLDWYYKYKAMAEINWEESDDEADKKTIL